MTLTLIVLFLTAILFAVGKLRSDIVALCAVLALLFGGVLTPEEALSGFSSPVVIMMAGLFIVGGGIFQTGLARMIGTRLVGLAGSSETRLFLLLMLTTGVIGAFVSNTGTVALMLPIAVSMAAATRVPASRLLMPLAFASSMGGMLTLIGTPPNLVIDEALIEAGYGKLGFFSFLPVGVVCLATGVLFLLPVSKRLLAPHSSESGKGRRRGNSLSALVEEYGLLKHVSLCVVEKGSPLVGMSIAEVRHAPTANSRVIRNVSQDVAAPDVRLHEGDTLYLSGSEDEAARFAAEYALDCSRLEPSEGGRGGLDFYHIGIAEIVLLRQSKFVGRRLAESGFRSKYSINVLAVRRDGRYIRTDLPEVKMQAGDVLLVQGTWANIGRLSNDEEHWVVLGQPLEEAARVTLDYKAPVAAAIMLLMVVAMAVEAIPVVPVTAVLAASVLMILTGCFRSVEAAYKTINWESLVLIAAMMPMSVALEKTGVSALVSQSMATTLGSVGPLALLAGIYATTSLLTLFISNTATAVLMTPIALSSAQSIGVSPLPMLFAVAVAASMCFASPFSTPPNALVMKAGQYSFMDYVKVGLPLQLVMGVVMLFALPAIFPF